MRRIVIAAGLVAALSGTVQANGELTGKGFTTGETACADGVGYWENPQPVAIRIKQVVLWMGLYLNGKADLSTVVLKDDAPIAFYAHDRYANPAELTMETFNYGTDYVTLAPGEELTITWHCFPHVEFPIKTHVLVHFLYTVEP